MRAIRAQTEKMKATQTQLLEIRTAETVENRNIFLLALALTTFVSIGALSVSARQIRKNQVRMEQEAFDRELIAKTRGQLAAVATSLAGNMSPEELAARVLEFLATRLDALSSKFFTFSKGRLELLASYGTDESKAPTLVSMSAEGRPFRTLVNEAMNRAEIWEVKDIPTDYWKIASSLGSTPPKTLMFMPLVFQGRKFGVIEMAMLRDSHSTDRDVLERLSEIVAINLNAAQSHQDLQELLEKTQQQAEELEAQQEELKASNEELEQQTRALETQQQSLNIKNRELEEVRIVLEEKARDLQLSSKYKSDFLAKMSHELRTPLNGVLILSTLLIENKEKNLSDQQKQFVQSIHDAGNDLLLLINDILDLSKIEARKLNLKAERFELKALLESLSIAFEPQAKAKDLEFRLEISDEAKTVSMETDRRRLEQVLRNFLSNAIKFTEKGWVSLGGSVSSNGKAVEILVSDSGIGIPMSKHGMVFQAFEQADSSVSRKFGGTGLGLTISRELAGLLGGEIQLESQEEVGSRFKLVIPIVLPAHSAEAVADQTATPLLSPSVSSSPSSLSQLAQSSSVDYNELAKTALKEVRPGERSILIVEDDPAFRNSVAETAKGHGFRVITAGDGELALAILERHSPDAILLDIKLPGMSGLGLLEMVKHMPHLRHIPVHMISALDYQHNTLRMGALGYLTKPVTVEKIRSALKRVETLISSRMRRILLIEDDARQNLAISELISGADVEIDAVRTGLDALEKLKSENYDCVILDLSLPDISGFDMLTQISSLEISIPPIVIYTAKELSPSEEEHLRKYSESIIIKGARSPERLLDEVNLFLHRVESLLPTDKKEMLSHLRSQKDNFEGKTVLLVDDDLRNLFALTSALESKNLNVRIAKDGIEALEALEKFRDIDLVLTDIMMPRMDGFETMKNIRKSSDARIRALPIVALTAKAMREDHQRCIDAGANDYIPKPVDLIHLTTILKVWLGPKGIFA
jgi:CheY-like chemotaxis protein